MDLIPRTYIHDLLTTLVNSSSEISETDVLLELADWLDATRADPDRLTRGDRQTLARVVDVLATVSNRLARRLLGAPILFTSRAAVLERRSVDLRPQRGTWKPRGPLWTSPSLSRSFMSSWMLRVGRGGDGKPHRFAMVLKRPAAPTMLVESLEEADALLGGSSPADALGRWRGEGVHVIDFSWRCVIEADASALLGERSSHSFPCGLGTECSLWLQPPEQDGDVIELGAVPGSAERPSTNA